MNVYFHNFWTGFLDSSDPINVSFFIKLLENVFNDDIIICNTPNETDILVESIFGQGSILKDKYWKYTFLFTGEAYYTTVLCNQLELYSCVLGFNNTAKNFVECPLFIPYMICNKHTYTPFIQIPEENKASVVISNTLGCVRNKFLDALDKNMDVMYGGSFKNNIGGKINGAYNSNNLLSFYRNTKFSITMENSCKDYYITEKILNGFAAGNIPVYWGSPNVTRYFNPKRFLELKTDSDIDIQELITKMVNITDKEYLDMINEPIFNDDIDVLFNNLVNSIKSTLCYT